MAPACRIIVMTGATRGLGRAAVDGFVAAGHTVVGCGRSRRLVDELGAAYGPPHRFDAIDVTDAVAVSAWADSVLGHQGTPDLLINNAARINAPGALWSIDDEDFRAVIDTNVTGTANVIRGFVPAMVDRRAGVIVNFSSGWGRSTAPEVAPYCASKYAIEGMTQALAQELPRGMAAIALNPGIIDTAMLRRVWAESAGAYENPATWARRAVPFLLRLGAADNGQALSV